MKPSNICNNAHPHKLINCVRGVHSFNTECVAREENEMLTSVWRGQTVFVISNGDFVMGALTDRAEAEMLINRNNLATQRASGDRLSGYWRMRAFTLDGQIDPPDLSYIQANRRTAESDVREDR